MLPLLRSQMTTHAHCALVYHTTSRSLPSLWSWPILVPSRLPGRRAGASWYAIPRTAGVLTSNGSTPPGLWSRDHEDRSRRRAHPPRPQRGSPRWRGDARLLHCHISEHAHRLHAGLRRSDDHAAHGQHRRDRRRRQVPVLERAARRRRGNRPHGHRRPERRPKLDDRPEPRHGTGARGGARARVLDDQLPAALRGRLRRDQRGRQPWSPGTGHRERHEHERLRDRRRAPLLGPRDLDQLAGLDRPRQHRRHQRPDRLHPLRDISARDRGQRRPPLLHRVASAEPQPAAGDRQDRGPVGRCAAGNRDDARLHQHRPDHRQRRPRLLDGGQHHHDGRARHAHRQRSEPRLRDARWLRPRHRDRAGDRRHAQGRAVGEHGRWPCA